MCGFVGIASTTSVASRSWLASACDTMVHRGPDATGEWWSDDGSVGLAHRRLSIVDLSPAGHQPMHFKKNRLSVVFNGEIYNFRELRVELAQLGCIFRTHSDTEVLLAAYDEWGPDCLSRLNGMFAFALYDSCEQTLFLARDRAGEKPLFYHLANGALHFSSELKALMANSGLSRRIDPVALDCYLAMGFVPRERCILKGFNKLPPAHALSFDLTQGTARVWRYWKMPELDSRTSNDRFQEAALLTELEDLLEDSVSRQMEADVPVGVLLSGGVDSSLITAMAARSSSKVRTFTIGLPGYGAFDETKHARLIARKFGTEHVELMTEGPPDPDLIMRLACQFDEPIADSSMIPTWMVSHMVRQYCTVGLGGDGGDELFGGYNHYSRLLRMQGGLGLIPYSLRRMPALIAERLMPVGLKGRNWLRQLNVNLQYGLPLSPCFFDSTTRAKLMEQYPAHGFVAEAVHLGQVPREPDLLQRATHMDYNSYLPEDILVKVDRTSMLNSLEIRAPLLDYRMIEFAFGRVPSNLKATAHNKKILLKRLAARVLPPEFDYQRKQGFSIPLDQWARSGPLRQLFWDVLTDSNCSFGANITRKLLAGLDLGRNIADRLFCLVMFELWKRQYKASL